MMRWECIHCNSVMDETNFIDFIKESDNDEISIQEAKVQYHTWRPVPESGNDTIIARTEALV
jgi:hypothetical protein